VAAHEMSKAGPVQPMEIPACPPSTLLQDFKNIYESLKHPDKKNELASDITMFQIGRVNGPLVPAHKAFLGNLNSEFTALCNLPPVPKSKTVPEHILLPGIKG